jgi:hypothetical protein
MASFYDILHQIETLLETEGRVSYNAIKREFAVDDDTLEDLKTELVEVKRVARDIDGMMLESVAAPDHIAQATPKRTNDTGTAIEGTASGSIRDESSFQPPSRQQTPAVKKSVLIWIGAACILVGILLPWASARVELPGAHIQRRTVSGLELKQGLLSTAVGLASAVLGFLAARRTIPASVVALFIIVIGVVVVGVTLDVINGLGSNDFGFFGGPTVRIRSNPEPGVFITLLGGGLLSLGGIVALFRTRRR